VATQWVASRVVLSSIELVKAFGSLLEDSCPRNKAGYSAKIAVYFHLVTVASMSLTFLDYLNFRHVMNSYIRLVSFLHSYETCSILGNRIVAGHTQRCYVITSLPGHGASGRF
jgi:hypothetical protein